MATHAHNTGIAAAFSGVAISVLAAFPAEAGPQRWDSEDIRSMLPLANSPDVVKACINNFRENKNMIEIDMFSTNKIAKKDGKLIGRTKAARFGDLICINDPVRSAMSIDGRFERHYASVRLMQAPDSGAPFEFVSTVEVKHDRKGLEPDRIKYTFLAEFLNDRSTTEYRYSASEAFYNKDTSAMVTTSVKHYLKHCVPNDCARPTGREPDNMATIKNYPNYSTRNLKLSSNVKDMLWQIGLDDVWAVRTQYAEYKKGTPAPYADVFDPATAFPITPVKLAFGEQAVADCAWPHVERNSLAYQNVQTFYACNNN